jgi:hypothetical protein
MSALIWGASARGIHMSKPDSGYPLWRKTTPVRVDAATLRQAEQHIDSCESCNPNLAEVPFEYVLDYLTGCDPEVTDYILPGPARCPRCNAAIRTGFWRWYKTEDDGRKVFVLPGTLVNLKSE